MKRTSIRSVLVVPVLSSAVIAFASIASAQETKNAKLEASIDTWVDAAAPEASHGDDDELVARVRNGEGTKLAFGFDWGEVKNGHIQSARLQLSMIKADGQASIQMAASGITGKWDESTPWSKLPDTTQTLSLVTVGSDPGTVELDLTALLRQTLEARSSLTGVVVSGPIINAPEYSRTFASSESDKGVPTIAVDYVPGKAERAPSPESKGDASKADKKEAGNTSPPGANVLRAVLVAFALAVVVVVVAVIARRRREAGEAD